MSVNTKIPLIALLILVVTSFAPIIHVSMMQIQGNLIHYISQITGLAPIKISIISNPLLGLITLAAFLSSSQLVLKILWTMLTAFFLMSAIIFLTVDLIDYGQYPYFVPFMGISLLGTLPLIIAGYIKEKIKKPVHNIT
ncbi:MAG: hypothetical protein ACI9A8_002010 [Cryomorphaceae bacterium]|jgi:hypothetical protein